MKIKKIICTILSLVVVAMLFTACDSLFIKETRYPKADVIYPQSQCWIKTTSFVEYEEGKGIGESKDITLPEGFDKLPITLENLYEVIDGEVVYVDDDDKEKSYKAESLLDLYKNFSEDIIVESSGKIRIEEGALSGYILVFKNYKSDKDVNLKKLMDNGNWYLQKDIDIMNMDTDNYILYDISNIENGKSYAMMDSLKEILGKPDVVTTPTRVVTDETTGEITYECDYYYYTMYFYYDDYALKLTIMDTVIDTDYREGIITNIKYMASGAIENVTKSGDYYSTDEYNSEFYEGKENVYDWGEELENGIFVNYEINNQESMFF